MHAERGGLKQEIVSRRFSQIEYRRFTQKKISENLRKKSAKICGKYYKTVLNILF